MKEKLKKRNKLLIVTDTWLPDVNGVVTAMVKIKAQLEQRNFEIMVLHPELFLNIAIPLYKDLQLCFFAKWKMKKYLAAFRPDYVHIVTPGPLGMIARNYCLKQKWKFSTFYHTRVPEYIKMRYGFLKEAAYKFLKWFNEPADKMMLSSPSLKEELEKKGFKNMAICPLGVDLDYFRRNLQAPLPEGLKKPVFTFLGRIGPEKNIRAFLECNLPGTKLIIGKGALKAKLEKEFNKDSVFVGQKNTQEVIDLLSISDVFVFPSKTDTFGLSILEALACGLPVAAYDVPGPKDLVASGKDGYCAEDLEVAANACLKLKAKDCRAKAKQYSWEKATEAFLSHLSPI